MSGQPGGDSFGLVGRTLDGRYRLDAVAGEGGFGVVYRGFHLGLEERVAVKCLKVPPHFDEQARRTFLERFRQEGRLLMKLSACPGAVRVLDLGSLSERGVDVPYLVMEWLEGASLDRFLHDRLMAAQGPLSPAAALAMLSPVIDALAVVHESGFAHRDIKPANLFVVQGRSGPTLKLLDFGVAKAMQEGQQSSTMRLSGTSSGFHAFSPPYGAPEQFYAKQFGESGPWTDVHALGLVLVEMIAGRRALAGDEYAEWLTSAISPVRPTPRTLGLVVPDALESLCARMLALRPEHRLQSASELSPAFVALAPTQPSPLSSGPPPAFALAPTAPAPASLAASGSAAAPAAATSAALSAAPSAVPSAAPSAPSSGTVPAPPSADALSPGTTGAPSTVPTGASPAATAHGPHASPAETRRSGPRSRASLASVALGAAIVAAVVGSGVAAYRARGPLGLSPSASARVVPEGTRYYRAFDPRAFERGGEREIGRGEARGTHHIEATFVSGKLAELKAVAPSGSVQGVTRVGEADGARVLEHFDGYGVLARTETVRPDGTVTSVARGGDDRLDGCARVKLELDAAGRVASRLCLGPKGQPALDEDGCIVRKLRRDPSGLAVAEACFDVSGAPASFGSNEHRIERTYDARGFLVRARAFGERGEPVAWPTGCFQREMTRDDAGNAAEMACLDAAGAKIAASDGTPARMRWAFDENGCWTELRWADADGKPATSMFDRLAISRRVDAQCEPIHVENLVADGLPGPAGSEPPITDLLRNTEGLVVERRCRGTGGPVSCRTGQVSAGDGSVVKYRHDDRGRVVSSRHFAADGKPARMSADFPHEERTSYSGTGRIAEQAYFDDEGRPALALGRLHRFAYEHDEGGRMTRMRSFGADGAPVLSSLGCHDFRFEYDALGRESARECRGVDEEPSATKGLSWKGVTWPSGSSRVVIRREGAIENVFYGPTGELIARVSCQKTPCYQ